jgi:pilus assembly protein CpaF
MSTVEMSTVETARAPGRQSQPRLLFLQEGEEPKDPFLNLKFQVHDQLIRELDIPRLKELEPERVRSSVEDSATLLLNNISEPITRLERARLAKEIADETLGFGPLEPLLNERSITEILVNRPNRVFVESQGVLYLSNTMFKDDAHIMRIVGRILGPIGRHVDESSPMVDARLPDGTRVNIIVPPLAVDGPAISIRKFSRDVLTPQDLIGLQTISGELLEFLKSCILGRINTVISGGTGTGKTTLLNILSSFISRRERLVTIEDPAELQLQQPHVVRLETRPPNIEGKGEVIQRDLVRNALRMRPDRIIVGEVRAGEAFDMLQAMNTGHDGSLTTVHCNSPRDALARIENMVLMANFDLPMRAIREQIASAIHLIIHMSRLEDGSRKVTKVTEIGGLEGEMITMQDIFEFRRTSSDNGGRADGIGQLMPTGLRPKLTDVLAARGIKISHDIFNIQGAGHWSRR